MIQTLMVVLALLAAYVGFAAWLKASRKLTFHQALLYAPLKLLYRIDDQTIAGAQRANAPVIYVITHQSRLDPALMLSLLPTDTLHILDSDSASSILLEPWRAAGRSIVFNAEHVFVSRRLVRHLRGRGRLAVYLPAIEDPMPRSQQSLYRAVARIAGRGDANVVAIHIHGYRSDKPTFVRADAVHFGLFPRLTISALPAVKLADLASKEQDGPTPSNALSQRSREAGAWKKAA